MADRPVTFIEIEGGLYDLKQEGRVLEYDIPADDLAGALRRRRLAPGTKIFIQDKTGRVTPMKGR